MAQQEPTAEVLADWRSHSELKLTPILTAALSTFQTKGYHGTTVRDIATGAGLTMPALYYHHSNKEGIFLALLDIAMTDLIGHVRGALAAGSDPRERFSNISTAIVLHVTHRNHLARVHTEYKYLGEDARRTYLAQRTEVGNYFRDAIAEGVEAGMFHVDDPEFTARAVLGMLQGPTRWYHPGGAISPDELASAYAEYALRMVGDARVRERPGPDAPRRTTRAAKAKAKKAKASKPTRGGR